MCAITGFISLKDNLNPKEYYKAHLLLKHRGPDDEGFVSILNADSKWGGVDINFLRGDDTSDSFKHLKHINESQEANILLGHRRLSIIDLSNNGHQPFYFENLYLSFNGEIYNYIELRRELKGLGYSFNTDTDTEVLLKAYHCWGESCVDKLNGMWAFSILDLNLKKVFLSRDRLGEKPMFFHFNKSKSLFLFSSEMRFIKSLINDISYNDLAIKRYMIFGDNQNADYTFYRDIEILKAGHCMSLDLLDFKLNLYKYWDVEDKPIDDFDLSHLEDLFLDSINIRLRTDTNIGIGLSGGFDSSTVAVLIDETIKKYNIDKKLYTFTAYFEGKEDREFEIAKDTLKNINAISNFVSPKYDNFIDEFEKMTYYQEHPVSGVAVFVHWLILKEVSKHNIKVYYGGHGGDELFGGYYSHYINYIINELASLNLKKFINKSKVFLSLRPDIKRFLKSILFTIFVKYKFNLLKHKFFNSMYNFNVYPFGYNNVFKDDWLKQDMYTNLKSYPLNEWLQNEDRNCMAFGIENRSPFLDHRIVEYCFSCANDLKFYDGKYKYLLRELGKNRLPSSLLNRTDKMGFTDNDFFDSPKFIDFIKSYIFSNNFKNTGLVDIKKLEKFISKNGLNNLSIWRIFNFSFWLDKNKGELVKVD